MIVAGRSASIRRRLSSSLAVHPAGDAGAPCGGYLLVFAYRGIVKPVGRPWHCFSIRERRLLWRLAAREVLEGRRRAQHEAEKAQQEAEKARREAEQARVQAEEASDQFLFWLLLLGGVALVALVVALKKPRQLAQQTLEKPRSSSSRIGA